MLMLGRIVRILIIDPDSLGLLPDHPAAGYRWKAEEDEPEETKRTREESDEAGNVAKK